jgi:hypothetical protein
MYYAYALLTCIPYILIDPGRIEHTLNSVVKQVALARIDSISDHSERLVFDYLHGCGSVAQLLGLVVAVE